VDDCDEFVEELFEYEEEVDNDDGRIFWHSGENEDDDVVIEEDGWEDEE
jgi:hypothetical protein